MAQDVSEFIDSKGLEKVVLMGHSMLVFYFSSLSLSCFM